MARSFPRCGFYLFNSRRHGESQGWSEGEILRVGDGDRRVVYCSGTTRGNWWLDGEDTEWSRLVWTCVPSVKEVSECWDYSESNPVGVLLPEVS